MRKLCRRRLRRQPGDNENLAERMSLFKRKPQTTVSVTYISHSGKTRQLAVPVGHTVMEAATSNGVDGIVAECGGSCMCATCHVYVDAAFLDKLDPIQENEEEMLGN